MRNQLKQTDISLAFPTRPILGLISMTFKLTARHYVSYIIICYIALNFYLFYGLRDLRNFTLDVYLTCSFSIRFAYNPSLRTKVTAITYVCKTSYSLQDCV